MGDSVYFEGDPATDSARRHMERVLKGEPARRWPWFVAALGGGALWTLYRLGQTAAARRQDGGEERPGHSPADGAGTGK